MPTEIKYGVVVDNKDINETGKIRVFILEQDLPSDHRTKNITELKNLLANIDAKANYVPWQKSTGTRNADPYLAEAFLPKQINLIPGEGQLVKILVYGESQYKEYVGPHINSLDNQKEGYVNSLNSFRSVNKTDLIRNGYVNKVNDFTLYGDNSQLVFSNKELFLRTNAQDFNGKKKNVNMALFQQSTFNNTMTLDKTKKKVIQEPVKVITHLLEITVDKKNREFLSERTVLANIKLISLVDFKNESGRTGVTNQTYITDKIYNGVIELEYDVTTDDVNDVSKVIDGLRLGLLNKKVNELAGLTQQGSIFTTTVTTPTSETKIIDHRVMTRNYTEIADRKEVDVMSFVIRANPNQKVFDSSTEALELLGVSAQFLTTNPKFYAKERDNLVALNSLVNKYLGNTSVESRLMNEGPRVIETVEASPKLEVKKDSYSIQVSDKVLMLSSQLDPNLISTDPTKYGLTQKDLLDLMDPAKLRTYSAVRGELLLQLLIRMIDLFLSHGHSTGNTVKNSLEEETRSELTKIKEELIKKVNTDLSGGPNLLNQYIRLN